MLLNQLLIPNSVGATQLPEFRAVHTLSASRERITAAAFSARGDWLALGCQALGQLLVWEWRTERYVLRQQVPLPGPSLPAHHE